MGISALIVTLTATLITPGQMLADEEVKQQNELFKQYWGTELEWQFDKLPAKSEIPDFRTPYSGHIYPDNVGGTANVLLKYDRAYNGRQLATAHERWDTNAYRKPITTTVRGGLFGFATRQVTTLGIPRWHGHCNGWAAATIRHAEPQNNVTVNGVEFTPADIKGMLAEIYIYNEPAYLCGYEYNVNPAMFHVAMTNWLGLAKHPIATEADPGEERWNYPIYKYAYNFNKINDRAVSVSMGVDHMYYSNGEFQRSPKNSRRMNFFYQLNLDENGKIVGGYFYRGTAMIDLLWVPGKPVASGKKGNERGNPHIDVEKVLAIWRQSVPDELRKKWVNIDPSKEDLDLTPEALVGMVPVGYKPTPTEAEVASTENNETEQPALTDVANTNTAAADIGDATTTVIETTPAATTDEVPAVEVPAVETPAVDTSVEETPAADVSVELPAAAADVPATEEETSDANPNAE